MADEEEHAVFVPPEALIEWEGIQLRPIPNQSPSTIHEDNQPSVVFPPMNHEGIHIHLHHQHQHQHQHQHPHQQMDTERTSPPSPVSTPRSRPPAMGEVVAFGWWDAGLDVLRVKFISIVSCLRSFSINRRSNFTLAGSILVLLLLYLRSRRRRRLRKESIIQLIRIIKEKDEKIHQLLYQIAQMNELLLASHHGVPLISKAASA